MYSPAGANIIFDGFDYYPKNENDRRHTTLAEFQQERWLGWKARARATNRIEKGLIIELAVLEGKYAAVCDELESVSNKLLPSGHQY